MTHTNVSDWEEKMNPDSEKMVYLRSWMVGDVEHIDRWIPHAGFGPEAAVANIEQCYENPYRIVVTRIARACSS